MLATTTYTQQVTLIVQFMLGITRQSDIHVSDTQIKLFNKSLLKLSEINIRTRVRIAIPKTNGSISGFRISHVKLSEPRTSWSVHVPVSISITIYLY